MEIIVTKKFGVLLVSNTVINQHELISTFDKQASHCAGAKVVFVGWIGFLPDRFRYNSKHGTAIEFEESSIDNVEFHKLAFGRAQY